MSSKVSKTHYSHIPEELLDLIFKQLKHVGDVFRFEAVCKSWKSVARQARSQQSSVMKLAPMLFVPSDKGSAGCYIFYNTTQGWLVTQHYRCCDSLGFVNPMSGSFVPLPPSLITKVIASCCPLDANCIVLAITRCNSRLIFCNLREGTWRAFGNVTSDISDIMYYKKIFYVLNITGEVLLCDLYPEPKVTNFAPPTESCCPKYLVESSGDILQVIRHVDDRGITFHFKVLKLDAGNWIPMTNLEDNSLLCSENQCLSVSSKDFPEFKSNCIYFVVGYYLRRFDLKTWRFETILNLSETHSSYHWFTPDVTLRSQAIATEPPFYTNSNFPLQKRKNLICLRY